MFTVELLDTAGLATRPVFDPRWTFVWDDEKDRDEVALAEAAEVVVRFVPRSAVVAVRRQGEAVAEVDVSELVTAFCEKNAGDPDCREAEGTAPN